MRHDACTRPNASRASIEGQSASQRQAKTSSVKNVERTAASICRDPQNVHKTCKPPGGVAALPAVIPAVEPAAIPSFLLKRLLGVSLLGLRAGVDDGVDGWVARLQGNRGFRSR